jgi:tetratricopeptide (TPR) repeat protein
MALSIFAVAMLVRLVHVLQIRHAPFFSVLMGDSHGYDLWAQRIAGGDWLGQEVFYQAPLYPYFLGAIYTIAGRHLLLVRIVQIAIGSASCALLALAVARLFSQPAGLARGPESGEGRRAGIIAGLMLALYAPAIFFDGLLQKSVLDVFFVCLAIFLLATVLTTARAGHGEKSIRPRPGRAWRLDPWLALGLTMGGLALTRENALVLIAVILVWSLAGWSIAEPRTPNAERFRCAALFLGGLAIVLAPVAARNAYVGGGFFITTSQFGPNFYIGNNPSADGTYQSLRFGRGAPEYERQDATELAERTIGRTLSPAQVSSFWTDKALEFITTQPARWLRLMARKFALLWNGTEMLDTESQEAHAEWSWPLRVGGLIGHFGVLVPLAVLGVMLTWPMRRRLGVFYTMTLAYAASVLVFYVFARYRYPLVPLLIVFAAAGVAKMSGAWLRPRYLAPVVAVALFANWPLLSTTLMRAVTETNLAVALQAAGRLDEATGHYQRAIALQPDYAPAYNNLGTALRAKGNLNEAIATYQRALGLRPEYGEAHYNLANALTDAGRPREAAEHFRIALRTMRGSADVHNNLGIALMGQGQTTEAIAEFRTAVALDPESAVSHRNLADALSSAKQYDRAIEEFRRAARLDPTGAAAYDLGSLLLELDRTEEAIDAFRASLQQAPESAQTHNNLGIALGIQGRLDDAIKHFEEALRIQPGFADAERNLATAREARDRRPSPRP